MPVNKILEQVRRGEKALGLAMGSYTDELVELCGVVGLDFVSYDGQHAASTPEIIDRMCRMADGWGVTPVMRVPDQLPGNILNYLDRGIQAVTYRSWRRKSRPRRWCVAACSLRRAGGATPANVSRGSAPTRT